LRLLEEYRVRTVAGLAGIKVDEDFHTDNFTFTFTYHTMEKEDVRIVYKITWEWVMYEDLNVEIREDIVNKVDFGTRKDQEVAQLKQYTTLFWQKTNKYFEKVNRIMLGDSIVTKVIRMTADNLNQKEQIVLNKSTLLSCNLDDLLK